MYIGIDPGLSGAVAILHPDGAYLAVHDTPVITLATTRGRRQEYDIPGLMTLLRPYADGQVHCVIEESQAMPGQGVRSTFTTGLGFGVWLALLSALAIPYTRVRPVEWKRALSLGADKEQSRLRAIQLFPAADLRHKKDHGRAESLLLAWHGWHTLPHAVGATALMQAGHV